MPAAATPPPASPCGRRGRIGSGVCLARGERSAGDAVDADAVARSGRQLAHRRQESVSSLATASTGGLAAPAIDSLLLSHHRGRDTPSARSRRATSRATVCSGCRWSASWPAPSPRPRTCARPASGTAWRPTARSTPTSRRDGTQRSDLTTYRANAGAIPGQTGDTTFASPEKESTRLFVIQVLYQAYNAQFGTDRVP